MEKRVQLQALLELLIDSINVYFQPPENVKLMYPCIVYSRSSVETKFANNNPYNHQTKYQVTVVDKDPDSKIPQKIAMLPMCSFAQHFTSDGLNHDVYNLYY